MSVVVTLEDDLDISRGDSLVGADHLPTLSADLRATLSWMSEMPLEIGKKYMIKHGTHLTRTVIKSIDTRIDINTLGRNPATSLALNDIGEVTLKTLKPLIFDSYTENRSTGSFILIDELSHHTLAAGMIL